MNHAPAWSSLGEHKRRWPLFDRAWAFQERLLAPRVLFFSERELRWSCTQETYCECGDTSDSDLRSAAALRELRRSDDREVQARMWRLLVDEYSRLSLTLLRDKLPALAGLAQRFQRANESDLYLAGLWQETILGDRLSYIDDSKFAVSGPQESSKSPSWSWVAPNCHVEFATENWCFKTGDCPNYEPCIVDGYVRIIDAQCSLASTNHLGEVSSGWLRLEGRLYEGKLQGPEDPGWAGWQESTLILDGLRDHAFYYDTFGERQLYLDAALPTRSSGSTMSLGEVPEMCIFCLPIVRIRTNGEQREHEGSERFMDWAMIFVCCDRERNLYRRIGLVRDGTVLGSAHSGLTIFPNGGVKKIITIR